MEEDGFLPKSSAPYRSRADFPQEMFAADGAEYFDRVSTFTASGAESFDRVTMFAASGAEDFDRVTMFAADGAEYFDRVTMFAADGAEDFDRVFLAPSEKTAMECAAVGAPQRLSYCEEKWRIRQVLPSFSDL